MDAIIIGLVADECLNVAYLIDRDDRALADGYDFGGYSYNGEFGQCWEVVVNK